ncbi:MAG: ATPase [Xanthobacteraceae bacterium]|nr:ATPase [Xanthobacteraceae bacterium]
MREIFEDNIPIEPLDPTETAKRGLNAPRRARFYTSAGVAEVDGHFAVQLDGKSVRTPAKRLLTAPSRELAQAIAAEWDAQVDHIEPGKMPLTRLANSTIDGVAQTPQPVADEIAKYLGSDLVFYRAGSPDGLVVRQAKHWDPIVAFARDTLGARFVLTEGVIYIAQPEPALTAARAAIPSEPWRLGALSLITTLTGSALIALAMAQGVLSDEAAWMAAHVDEDWNISQWGTDDQATARRAGRFLDLQAAATVLRLLP